MKRFIIAVLAIALVGCDNNNGTGPNGELNATFNLRTINGQTLPLQLSDGSTLTGDVLTFFNDGTYSDVAQYSGGQLATEQGYYSNSNGSLQFQDSQSGLTYTGSLSGDVLTEFINGYTEVYARQ